MIEAAGGVIWRTGSRGQVKVLLIHRPAYDDWTFPKGKLEAGEPALAGALREVLEETGFRCEAGPSLPEVRYTHRKGRAKRVRYWAMQVLDGDFAPNREVDVIRWARPGDAAALLSYEHDLEVLAAAVDLLAAVV